MVRVAVTEGGRWRYREGIEARTQRALHSSAGVRTMLTHCQ
jgi:hypothetical protein